MTYTSFLTLCEYLDRCERERAKYTAAALNAPKMLFNEESSNNGKFIDLKKEDGRIAFLTAINGK